MATASLLEEQRWAFDLDGYIVLRGLLRPAEAAAAAAAAVPANGATANNLASLVELPALRAAIERLAGGQMRLHGRAAYDGTPGKLQELHPIEHDLDRAPRRLVYDGQWATDSSADEHHRLGYDVWSRPDVVCVWGLRAVWGLGTGDSCLVVAPCTHKSNVLPPPCMGRAEQLGATVRLSLQAGDCVLAAATTLVGAPGLPLTAGRPAAAAAAAACGGGGGGTLLELVYADRSRVASPRPSAAVVHEPWHSELSPAQRTRLIGGRGHFAQPQLHPSLLQLNAGPDGERAYVSIVYAVHFGGDLPICHACACCEIAE
jgi:hypothetical protein